MTDYLEEAKRRVDFVEAQMSDEAYLKYGLISAQMATACATIALVELLRPVVEENSIPVHRLSSWKWL